MASQRDIRRRIQSSRNIKQITRAMQFVAASKLKRAQEATLAARPYAEKLDEVLADAAIVLSGEDHPLLVRRETGKRLLVLVTTDRGLAGALNTNTIRFAAQQIAETTGETTTVTVGRKGRDAMRRSRMPIEAHFDGFREARLITDGYLDETFGRVDIVYSHFVSTLVQRPTIDELLPIVPREDTAGIPGNQFIFEPNPGAVLEQLLPRYVATRLFQAALETTASFFSSQMVAMKNATENAEELIEDLTLEYNKVRQSNITREMIEIASGAQAG